MLRLLKLSFTIKKCEFFLTDPIGQPEPTVVNVTSSTVSLSWEGPNQPNGIIIDYSVQQRRSSATPNEQDVGVAFYGTGLVRFEPGMANLGGFSNEIRLMFRTLVSQGTLLYYINQAGSDLLAIELRNGIPYFVFDAGSGSAEVAPSVQSNVTFSDGQWHSLVATLNGQVGSILVDSVYSGTGMSPGQDSIISSSQRLSIGGIPSSSPANTLGGGVTLSRTPFAGCVFGVTLNSEELDMTLSFFSEGVDFVEGCPVDVESGWRLRGNGYVALEEDSITNTDFSLTFKIRTTDSDALVLFAFSPEVTNNALSIEIRNSSLYAVAYSNGTVRTSMIGPQNSLCQMNDISVQLVVNGSNVLVGIENYNSIVTNLWPETVLSAPVYFGGVARESPSYSLASQLGVSLYNPLSGCVRAVELVTGGVSVGVNVGASYQVRFDGCGPRGSGCGSTVDTNVGMTMMYTDSSLTSFRGMYINTSFLYSLRLVVRLLRQGIW